jgi:DNA-cytosine methyltransferase
MNVLSLFDGMSCGRIALDRVGIHVDNYYASELDKYAIKVTQANWPNTIQLGDVTKWRDWDIDWRSIDLLIGGSPCQGFSFAGKQLAFDDPRSKLFFVYVDILNHIRSVNSDVKFMLENVKMKKEYLDVITDTMRVDPVFINSNLVSAQNRQRWYWTDIGEIDQPEDKGIMLVDILESEGHGVIKSHGVKSQCIDANYHKGVDNHGQRTVIIHQTSRGNNPGGDRALDGKTPSLTSNSWQHNNHLKFRNKSKTIRVGGEGSPPDSRQNWDNAFNSKSEYRKLTPVECERLQTVPDNYTNHVSNTQRYKMLGNGWTVDVIAHIFEGLTQEVSFF